MLIERKKSNELLTDTPALHVIGSWACINIETNAAWPAIPQDFQFEGRQIWLIPHSLDAYPGLAINCTGQLNREDAYPLLHRALSLILWLHDAGGTVVHMTGGNLPLMAGRPNSHGVVLRSDFDFTDLPEIVDQRGKLALALMREGRGLNHPAYAFLSFFRALETAIPNGKQRGQWVTDNVNDVQGHRAKEALAKLKGKVAGDIGAHLRESGRHAIAHAQAHPIINPDEPSDARRLYEELPIIEALAVLAIEDCLGVQTSHTIWNEHLYELRGWKRAFGEQAVADIIAGRKLPEGQMLDVPPLNIRLRKSEPFVPLEGMQPIHAGILGNKVEMAYRSADGLVEAVFLLNFAEERLEIDPETWLRVYDDGSLQAARNAREIERFSQAHFGNGEVQMWDAEKEELVSRLNAFIPVNMFFNPEGAKAALARYDAIIAEREASATDIVPEN